MAATNKHLLSLILTASILHHVYPQQCHPITVPMCQDLGLYNQTQFPNAFGHDNQEEAGLEVHQFWPLIEIQCSADLQLFLCSLYTPACTNSTERLVPCQEMCERAREGCGPLMRQYGFGWPLRMTCDGYPKRTSGTACIDLDGIVKTSTPSILENTSIQVISSSEMPSTGI